MKIVTLTAIAALAAAFGPAATAAQPAAQSCFRSSEIRNHTVGDGSTLYIKVGLRDVYRLSMAGACLTGVWPTDPMVIETAGGSGLICKPLDLTLSMSRGGFATPCIVRTITKLTPAEAAALPAKLKP